MLKHVNILYNDLNINKTSIGIPLELVVFSGVH